MTKTTTKTPICEAEDGLGGGLGEGVVVESSGVDGDTELVVPLVVSHAWKNSTARGPICPLVSEEKAFFRAVVHSVLNCKQFMEHGILWIPLCVNCNTDNPVP